MTLSMEDAHITESSSITRYQMSVRRGRQPGSSTIRKPWLCFPPKIWEPRVLYSNELGSSHTFLESHNYISMLKILSSPNSKSTFYLCPEILLLTFTDSSRRDELRLGDSFAFSLTWGPQGSYLTHPLLRSCLSKFTIFTRPL